MADTSPTTAPADAPPPAPDETAAPRPQGKGRVAAALTYTGGLQGTGDTKGPLYISIISQLVVPLGICLVIRQTGTLDAIDVWVAILAGHATRCALSVIRFRQGNWRNIAVGIEPEVKSAS